MKNSRPIVFDGAPDGYRPIVQVIDNFVRNHKLGLISETKVGQDSMLIGAGSLTGALGDLVRAADSPALDLGSLFEANRPEVLALAKRVMEKCVLEKIMPPTPPLERTWIIPGGPYYLGQWIWDTMFVVDLLSLLPDKRELIRDVFQNYWDFQDRWNRKMPDYAHDMITVAIKTVPLRQAGYPRKDSGRNHRKLDSADCACSDRNDGAPHGRGVGFGGLDDTVAGANG